MKVATDYHRDTEGDTRDFVFNQTMLRIKDPAVSLAFYREVLGMTLVKQLAFPKMSFSLYFLAYGTEEHLSSIGNAFGRAGVLELTHNYGTDTDAGFAGYHNGNSEPQGFGHIGICVPDVDKACERFERMSVEFVKRPNDGAMQGLAFIKDPDGYWIEILSTNGMERLLQTEE
ncbi:MAG: lactoylglutathione lyase [Pseudomonadota bacterium]